MKTILSITFLFLSLPLFAIDNPKDLIRAVNKKFNLVENYKADIQMKFDIPGVKMHNLSGKVIYKKPSLFRIKAKGIFFLPKQNPMQNMSAMLLDTNSYTTIISGYETIENKKCAIVNIIPLQSNAPLILGKFWIDVQNPLVYKSQITTKDNGTIESYNFFGKNAMYALPEKIIVKVEVGKLKVPKMMAIDLNKKSKPKENTSVKETGTIELFFTNYAINTSIDSKEFDEKKD